jgi:hypothetical protein
MSTITEQVIARAAGPRVRLTPVVDAALRAAERSGR